MRFLFIVDNITKGGAGRVVSVLSKRFRDIGHSVSILLMAQELSQEDSRDESRNLISLINESRNLDRISPIKKIAIIRRTIKKEKPDLVIAFINEYGEYTVLANSFLKTRVIVSERTDPSISPENRVLRLIRNPLYACADKVVFQTEDMMNYFPSYVRKKGEIIFNPISELLPDVYGGEREKRFVSVGRLIESKNYEMSIRAFKSFYDKHPEYTYDIYGEGPFRPVLQSLIEELKLEQSVFLRGHTTDVFSEIWKAKAFLMPSNYEGMSNALNEAMALGLPTITTDHPIGAPKMLINDHDNGIIVPLGDIRKMSIAMTEIAENDELASNLSKEGSKLRGILSIETISTQWLDLCKDLLGIKGTMHD